MAADMEVDKVADMVADIDIDIDIDMEIQFCEKVGIRGLVNWAQTFSTRFVHLLSFASFSY